jgi:D-alanyl-D-alanine carboxypeptidase/D-alanyl-D-alanine carboxypeptidase (penicillin-binding protein 5/6)
MNQKAAELGLQNTHFETPSGLDGESHYTTALDLSLLTRYALKNPDFKEAAASKSATLCYGNPPYRRTLTNHNKMLKNYDGCIGVKTGFTKKSGRCLVTAATKDGKTVIAVTLNCPDDWNTHKTLLDYGLERTTTVEISPEKSSYTVPVISGKVKEITVAVASFKTSKVTDGEFTATVNLPPFLYAPIAEGEEIGRVVYKKDGEILKETAVLSPITVEAEPQKKNSIKMILKNVKFIFRNIWEI